MICTLTALVGTLAVPATGGVTTRVSVASDATQGNDHSWASSVSADGRYVAFYSNASNLVPGDISHCQDIFVHDRVTGQTTRVSVASDATEGNSDSCCPSISADGRYVAFSSYASNLVPGDTNGKHDIFVHDRQTGQTTRVSVSSDGAEGNGNDSRPTVSADGRYLAWDSDASNLVPGDTNDARDIFVHDQQTGETARVSVASDGTQGDGSSIGPAVSADGRYVGFASSASNLVPVDTRGVRALFLHDRATGATSILPVASDGAPANADAWLSSISPDGRYLAFHSVADNLAPGDTNGRCDVFVHDRETRQTTRVSVASDGTQGDRDSREGLVSADGRWVAFYSSARNLVAGDTNGTQDVFMHDRYTGETTRVSVASDGAQASTSDQGSGWHSMTPDGRCVVFASGAGNLVPDDTNGVTDVFVHEVWQPPTCDISYVPSSPTTDDVITFYSGAADGDGSVVSVDWNFGDGGTASGDPAAHQYAMPGTYTVIVTVCDDDGYCTECTLDITIGKGENITPVCDVTYEPLAPEPGQDITFDANAYDPNPWGEMVSYEWDFGDGYGATLEPATHAYSDVGDYTVCVTVTDDQGGQTTCCMQLTVVRPCDCDIAIDRTHCKMPAAGHIGQCKTGRIGARNMSYTGYCEVVMRVTDNAGNVVFETVETIGPGRRIHVRFQHCYTADEVGRNLWAWEVWPAECTELTPWNNVHLRKVNVQPGVRSSTTNWLPLWRSRPR